MSQCHYGPYNLTLEKGQYPFINSELSTQGYQARPGKAMLSIRLVGKHRKNKELCWLILRLWIGRRGKAKHRGVCGVDKSRQVCSLFCRLPTKNNMKFCLSRRSWNRVGWARRRTPICGPLASRLRWLEGSSHLSRLQ